MVLVSKCVLTRGRPLSRLFWPLFQRSSSSIQMVEIGMRSATKEGSYESGQVFLHKLFGYRGVVLYPWKCKLHLRVEEKPSDSLSVVVDSRLKEEPTHHMFYTVAVDDRDCLEHLNFGLPDESMKYIDYVSHEDIVPYKSTEFTPVSNRHALEFFSSERKGLNLKPKVELWSFKEVNPHLELSDVYTQTTDDIRITVMPLFIGIKKTPLQASFMWKYHIRIENLGKEDFTLRLRSWVVFNKYSEKLMTIDGRGVVGQEPRFSASQRVYQYCSYTTLDVPPDKVKATEDSELCGHMWGQFQFDTPHHGTIAARIPKFDLIRKLWWRPKPGG